MGVFVYLVCLILAIPFLRFLHRFVDSNGLPRNWPFVGMTPTILLNFHRIVDKVSEIVTKSNGTILYRGIWFTNSSFLATADPQNVRYLMNTNYRAYVKGSEWRKQFDVFGEALFNSDGEEWKRQRRIFHAFLNHPQFLQSLARVLRQRLEQGLIKVLEHVSKQELVVDLQDLLVRYASDIGWILATGSNPQFLSIEFPENRFHKAMSDVLEAAFYRCIMPDSLWKLQSWLQVGLEKKRSHAWKYFDDILAEHISIQREKSNKAMASNTDEGDNFNFLKCYLTGHKVTGPTPRDSLIRDNVIHFLFASDDTYSLVLTWFFYLLAKNPMAENKIREEVKKNLSMKEAGGLQIPSCFNELNKLTYLHAAFCETLRLCPPIPFEFRTCAQQDILPSGHRVDRNMRIIIGIHAMGRMEFLWGEDCHEFKPERWITEEGKLKREAPSKFSAFLAGPRICPGKELSFFLMKATATAVLHNYKVHVTECQNIAPKNSAFYQMKNGLMVRIKNRWN
ncbi:PREDICTED: alkane hydroxylase MAH1 isoform X1 [Theobroma cacao]|uniref:Alkane hydroxylase MAH1 isoform X1 n=1 Tax=Theobroma cacao TaxID=3641 RepID=A0AB32W1E1_THECC|nr:PREDICTED: alkane hydroxylase MAH1 isoform X1 [Theobroma cacao]